VYASRIYRDKVARFAERQIDVQQEANPVQFRHRYFITLTVDQEDDDPTRLLACRDKIIKSKLFGIKKYEGCIELTEVGKPHCHILVWTNKFIRARDVKKYNDGHNANIKRVPACDVVKVRNYINKDVDDRIRDYTEKYGIEQFFECQLLEQEEKEEE